MGDNHYGDLLKDERNGRSLNDIVLRFPHIEEWSPDSLLDYLDERISSGDYRIHHKRDDFDQLIVYVKNDIIRNVTGGKYIDRRKTCAEFKRRYPGKQLSIRENRAESGKYSWQLSGKDRVFMWMLTIPFIFPGLIYRHKKCQGMQFVITGS